MAEREEVDDRTFRVPEHLIETINKLVRTSRQMLTEIGREPTSEELAQKLGMPARKSTQALKNRRATDQPEGADRRLEESNLG
jgi:RNA polymerase primary sigma factor